VLAPWLVAAWLAGAWVGRLEGSLAWGAGAGLILLTATVPTYLAMAGADAPGLLPGLPLLAVVAGPCFGVAGSELNRGPRGRIVAAVALGGVLVVEGVLMQQVASESLLERGLFVVEALAGVFLAAAIGGRRAAALVVVIGAAVLGVELLVLSTIGPSLAQAAY
jgi:Family of unknown function (DUF6518)